MMNTNSSFLEEPMAVWNRSVHNSIFPSLSTNFGVLYYFKNLQILFDQRQHKDKKYFFKKNSREQNLVILILSKLFHFNAGIYRTFTVKLDVLLDTMFCVSLYSSISC